MSPKELLYIEDTLDHLSENKKYCAALAAETQDASLRTLLQELSTKQNALFTKFYSLLNT